MNDFAGLDEPFSPNEIAWRMQQAGVKNDRPWIKVLAYVDARAIMKRLDNVVGRMNWQDEYSAGPDGGVKCRILIRDENGGWVHKEDGADNTDIEAVKGGLSDALKRAAVKWGIGRYLYDLPKSQYGIICDNGQYWTPPAKDGKYPAISWNPPPLPAWALPKPKDGEIDKSAVADDKRVIEKYSKPYLSFVPSLKSIQSTKDFASVWAEKSLMKVWVSDNKIADFVSWDQVEQCNDSKRLDKLFEAINDHINDVVKLRQKTKQLQTA